MNMTASDLSLLRRAIALAGEARAGGNPPFGSLLVDGDGKIIAEQHNTTLTDDDITAHPELKLAKWSASHLTVEQRRHATMYTSCQPCGMCSATIARAGLGRVMYALSTQQLANLQPEGHVPPESTSAEMVGPALLDEAIAPVRGYY